MTTSLTNHKPTIFFDKDQQFGNFHFFTLRDATKKANESGVCFRVGYKKKADFSSDKAEFGMTGTGGVILKL